MWHFDLVPVGSRWKGGVDSGRRSLTRHSFAVSISGTEVVGNAIEDGDVVRFPSDLHAGAPCFRLDLKPDPDQARIKIAALPVMELLRALFGPSDVFLKQLLDGHRDRSPLPDRFLFDRALSRFSPDASTVLLHCDRELGRDEAMVAAMMVSNRMVLDSHDAVVNRLKASVEWRRDLPAFAYTTWPFDMVTLDFEGHWIARAVPDGRVFKRFLVTRIVEITPVIDFDTIEISYETTEVSDDMPPSSGRVPGSNRSQAYVVSRGSVPTTNMQPVVVRTSAGMFGPQVRIVPSPRVRPTGARPLVLGTGPGLEEGVLSTADAQSGADRSVGKANARRSAAQLAADSEHVAKEAAACRRQTYQAVHALCAADGYRLENLSGGPPETTGCVMLHLVVGNRSVIVADAGTSSADPKSLGIITRDDRGDVMQSLPAIKAALAKHGGRWRSPEGIVKGCGISGISRSDARRADRKLYSALIGNKVLEILKRVKRPN